MSTPTTTDGMANYRAIAMFGLNLNVQGKVNSYTVKPGDDVFFDGLYASFDGVIGESRSLKSVIGEWVVLASESSAPSAGSQEAPALESARESTRNLVIEHSDDQVVATTGSAGEQETNVHGIYMDESQKVVRKVVSDEERVVKKTSYDASGKTAAEKSSEGHVRTASGQEAEAVYKSARATPANITAFEFDGKNVPNGDTQYNGRTEVTKVLGESAQDPSPESISDTGSAILKKANQILESDTVHDKNIATIESSTNLKEVPTNKKAPARAVNLSVESYMDGEVVAKTSNIKTSSSSEGIETSLSIGGNQEMPEVTATVGSGNNQEAIIMGKKATIGSKAASSEAPADLGKSIESLESFSVDGKPWLELHWVKKLKFIESCNDQLIISSLHSLTSTPAKIVEALNKKMEVLKSSGELVV